MWCDTQFDGCIKLPGEFRNGTTCGNDGFCYGGVCSNPDLIGKTLEWVSKHRNLAITIGVVGGAIIIIVFKIFFSNMKISDKTKGLRQFQETNNEDRLGASGSSRGNAQNR
jgi:hypothetical protein